MVAVAETRSITVTGARACWRETIGDENDLEKFIRIIMAELCANNTVHLIVVIGNPYSQVAITEDQ